MCRRAHAINSHTPKGGTPRRQVCILMSTSGRGAWHHDHTPCRRGTPRHVEARGWLLARECEAADGAIKVEGHMGSFRSGRGRHAATQAAHDAMPKWPNDICRVPAALPGGRAVLPCFPVFVGDQRPPLGVLGRNHSSTQQPHFESHGLLTHVHSITLPLIFERRSPPPISCITDANLWSGSFWTGTFP
jgi:hypothetical protein